MKVLHVLSSDDRYGSAQCLLELLEYETKRGNITPIVITPRQNRISEICDQKGVENYSIAYSQFQIPKHDIFPVFALKYLVHTLRYYLTKDKYINELCVLAKSLNVDLIHTNTSVLDIGAEVSRKTGIPHVWHLREFGKKDFHFYATRPFAVKWMSDSANRFIAISKAVKDVWEQRGIDQRKIVVLYDGVDGKRFVSKLPSSDGKLKMVMCGSFCEAKGQLVLVKAFAEMDNTYRSKVELSLYGRQEGAYYDKVVSEIEKRGLQETVLLKGYSENIPQELRQYDVGVLCSRAEAFGRVTVEYMMAGLCPLATEAGANIELIKDHDCGVLYPYGDVGALRRAIERLADDPDVVRSKGELSRQIAYQYYDINNNAEEIIRCFHEASVNKG